MHNLVSPFVMYKYHCSICSLFCSDEPPKVINQPKSLSKVCTGTAVVFAVQATGTEPLGYQWEWMPAEEEGGSEEWQPCDAEWSDGATLTIPSVQKCNEGSYRCVISNYADSQNSNPAKISVGKNPLVFFYKSCMTCLVYSGISICIL